MAISHTSLTTHSAPFTLTAGRYGVSFTGGTLTRGIDNVELQGLINGNWTSSLNPPIRFDGSSGVGATKATGMLAAGYYRWLVPTGHTFSAVINSL
ncbi:hypothetical protein [Bradyrhizobium sp. SZCCHNS3053]|uniref:hypothetical protein n=1 Tax=Bradyrhizobium sp. SZCCHNS3053 TaxID=3057322 RepID=UPI002916698D|nr:hypothetical protein [Bradyrhizobium sp. SZCCHNS3053]